MKNCLHIGENCQYLHDFCTMFTSVPLAGVSWNYQCLINVRQLEAIKHFSIEKMTALS